MSLPKLVTFPKFCQKRENSMGRVLSEIASKIVNKHKISSRNENKKDEKP